MLNKTKLKNKIEKAVLTFYLLGKVRNDKPKL